MSSAPTVPTAHFAFDAIGTAWVIDIFEPISLEIAGMLQVATLRRIDTFDHHYSRFRTDSLVHSISQGPGIYRLPPDAKSMFDLYAKLYDVTKGKVTPLIGDLLSDAGYDATYSLAPKALRKVSTWEETLDYAFPFLTTKRPVMLDVGAVGKGYLVDIVGRLLATKGIQDYCINAGGDILGHRLAADGLTIGLEDPDDVSQIVGIAQLAQGSLCGSSGSRRTWGRYHHILDPQTQSSPRYIKAVWVYADTALLADALTTALFFVPAAELAQHFAFEYAMIHKDNSLEYSARFPARFFTEEQERT